MKILSIFQKEAELCRTSRISINGSRKKYTSKLPRIRSTTLSIISSTFFFRWCLTFNHGFRPIGRSYCFVSSNYKAHPHSFSVNPKASTFHPERSFFRWKRLTNKCLQNSVCCVGNSDPIADNCLCYASKRMHVVVLFS